MRNETMRERAHALRELYTMPKKSIVISVNNNSKSGDKGETWRGQRAGRMSGVVLTQNSRNFRSPPTATNIVFFNVITGEGRETSARLPTSPRSPGVTSTWAFKSGLRERAQIKECDLESECSGWVRDELGDSLDCRERFPLLVLVFSAFT